MIDLMIAMMDGGLLYFSLLLIMVGGMGLAGIICVLLLVEFFKWLKKGISHHW